MQPPTNSVPMPTQFTYWLLIVIPALRVFLSRHWFFSHKENQHASYSTYDSMKGPYGRIQSSAVTIYPYLIIAVQSVFNVYHKEVRATMSLL